MKQLETPWQSLFRAPGYYPVTLETKKLSAATFAKKFILGTVFIIKAFTKEPRSDTFF